MKNLYRLLGGSSLCAALLTFPLNLQAAVGRMDYRDAEELAAALEALDQQSDQAQLYTIGYSTDYVTHPDQPRHYPIYALRISASANESIQDDPRKNSILFEAGMHPRVAGDRELSDAGGIPGGARRGRAQLCA
jgi:hypothetical protein